MINIIGIVSGFLTAISMMPQLIKIIKEKSADEISIFAFSCLILGLIGWIVYGIMQNDLPIILSNSLSFLINATLLALSIYYKSKK